MGQSDILEYLRNERLCGNDGFFTRKMIEQAMTHKGLGALRVREQLNALYVYKFLEVRINYRWERGYRLRKQYIRPKGVTVRAS
jgi:hypothetical protein